MWPAENPAAATLSAAVLVCGLALGTYSLLIKAFPGRATANAMVAAITTIGVAIVLAAGLDRLWEAQRERDARMASARLRHLQRLQALLREESGALSSIAQALRDGRYFALVANDARRAVWQDRTLTADVERHFPEYYQEREHLIDAIVAHDGELARARQIVSAGLTLSRATEPYRADLLQALVRKCGGTGVRPQETLGATDAVRAYDEYRCNPETTYVCRMFFDRAEDLADAALLASAAARRDAEETVLHGSCTYAPGE
jgi:hypothetical protein